MPFGNIIGESPAIRAMKTKALKVADSSSTVLIVGESGTGKDLLAKAIHQAGPRRANPFIAINCGGIPETLLESELFGYTGGAFTGASQKGRVGKFELAQGGILFLDEISAMPLYMQVKLLRVLQERVIIRLGSNKLVPVDVRVIAASNEDLQDCIRRGAFREDLYYRLNVIPLLLPSLRERHGDVPILAEYFLQKYCTRFNKRKPWLHPVFVRTLESYIWPGNVRELEHVMEYAVNMMPDNGTLTYDCLPDKLLEYTERASPAGPLSSLTPEESHAATFQTPVNPPVRWPASAPMHSPSIHSLLEEPGESASSDTPIIVPLHVLEERAIRTALEHFGTSAEGKRKAAQALGLSLATLYRKLKAFSI